ncbi:hypothetical protein D3C76_1577910 [compost metagenome]
MLGTDLIIGKNKHISIIGKFVLVVRNGPEEFPRFGIYTVDIIIIILAYFSDE